MTASNAAQQVHSMSHSSDKSLSGSTENPKLQRIQHDPNDLSNDQNHDTSGFNIPESILYKLRVIFEGSSFEPEVKWSVSTIDPFGYRHIEKNAEQQV